jgi:hypothetical protein
VQEFLDAWSKLKIESVLAAKSGGPVSLAQFLSNTPHYLGLLGPETERMLVNRLAFHFGADKSTSQGDLLTLLKYMQWFQLILVAEYKFESIVLLRRTNCWDIKEYVLCVVCAVMSLCCLCFFVLALPDCLYFLASVSVFSDLRWASATSHNLSSYATPAMSVRDLDERIQTLNSLDMIVYRQANNSFWGQIERQVSFRQEVERLKETHQQAMTQCDAILKELNGSPAKTHPQHSCVLKDLDVRGAFQYMKTRVFSTRQYHSSAFPTG